MKAFREKGAWLNYGMVAAQKFLIFQPDDAGRATRFVELADRVDYLEAYGHSVNETLGGEGGPARVTPNE
jgi:hypothetical protein